MKQSSMHRRSSAAQSLAIIMIHGRLTCKINARWQFVTMSQLSWHVYTHIHITSVLTCAYTHFFQPN